MLEVSELCKEKLAESWGNFCGPREVKSETEDENCWERSGSFTYTYSRWWGRGGPPAALIPAAIDPGMWLNIINYKPLHQADLKSRVWRDLSSTICVIVRNVHDNLYGKYSDLFWRRNSKSVTKTIKNTQRSWNCRKRILLKSCYAYK